MLFVGREYHPLLDKRSVTTYFVFGQNIKIQTTILILTWRLIYVVNQLCALNFAYIIINRYVQNQLIFFRFSSRWYLCQIQTHDVISSQKWAHAMQETIYHFCVVTLTRHPLHIPWVWFYLTRKRMALLELFRSFIDYFRVNFFYLITILDIYKNCYIPQNRHMTTGRVKMS